MAADLVALHAGKLRTPRGVGQLAGEEVVVRAADADRLGADQHLARPWIGRLGTVDDSDRADPLGDGGLHRRSAPHLGRRLDDQLELGDLVVVAHDVALDGRREAALRGEAQLLD